MMAFSHLKSKRGFETARMSWRAVTNIEISSNLLKARMMAFSHQSSKWGSVTAGVVRRAVAFIE
ncbi:MAG: hypothetical protein IJH11_07060, partial [Lachnospiraceae bacterium]|nr:hypothetical protein [Lachnospiraceae bacterium]